jgi:predicted MFS family arabinose efflux permease
MGIIPKGQRGLASAINSIVWRLPNSVTTVFGGLLLAGGFYELPFLIAATFYIIAISAFYLLFREAKPLS